jgi:hypothetical protein
MNPISIPGLEADHSTQSCAKAKNEWHYTSTPHAAFTVCKGTTSFLFVSLLPKTLDVYTPVKLFTTHTYILTLLMNLVSYVQVFGFISIYFQTISVLAHYRISI